MFVVYNISSSINVEAKSFPKSSQLFLQTGEKSPENNVIHSLLDYFYKIPNDKVNPISTNPRFNTTNISLLPGSAARSQGALWEHN